MKVSEAAHCPSVFRGAAGPGLVGSCWYTQVKPGCPCIPQEAGCPCGRAGQPEVLRRKALEEKTEDRGSS